ncbi:MAG TPA: hypothetical protein VL069_07000 [Opitutus sp.]|nr:hypothetical protein [Opitutus sp.]
MQNPKNTRQQLLNFIRVYNIAGEPAPVPDDLWVTLRGGVRGISFRTAHAAGTGRWLPMADGLARHFTGGAVAAIRSSW